MDIDTSRRNKVPVTSKTRSAPVLKSSSTPFIIQLAMLKVIPKDYHDTSKGTLKLLWEEEWRAIGITQSLGWEHYEVHEPEPHILLFK
ncbi:unnamed protein product [Parascedosporium putredinis]|uniref:Cyclin-dependent kinases regulatory subunit n=1 Tax=Parascedosporium putredinis TaxID=1442378 RepID=A0A9P1ME89_9PEZI|nr:unnamed protein product [Parascedosporium putredinis]CAI8002151.1 unnamed protein product [Parascedosporium putredinis]